MKLTKHRVIILIGLIIFLFLVSLGKDAKSPPAQLPILPETLKEKHVLTYFYFWYDLPDGVHSTALGDYPADENTSYKNLAWFKKQLADMEEAGVDILLAVYWSEFEPSSVIGLGNLVEAREQLLREGKKPPAIALFLDTGIFDRLPRGEKNFTKEEGKQRFYGFIKEFYEIIPPHHWSRIEEKPVISMWGAWFGIRFDQSTFDYIQENFEKDFGTKPYIIREASWNYAVKPKLFGQETDFSQPIFTNDIYKWGAALYGYEDIGGNVAAVGPGYDERHLTERNRSLFTDRGRGKWYEDNFKKAIQSGKPFIALETWNEFHEASDIAESEEYGRTYIELTRRYVDHFKAQTALED